MIAASAYRSHDTSLYCLTAFLDVFVECVDRQWFAGRCEGDATNAPAAIGAGIHDHNFLALTPDDEEASTK